MGVCASSGGMFNNYAIVQGVDHIVPVDIYLPGCPPRPEMLLDSILKLHDKIQNMKLGVDREVEVAGTGAGPAAPPAAGRRPGRCPGPRWPDPARPGPRGDGQVSGDGPESEGNQPQQPPDPAALAGEQRLSEQVVRTGMFGTETTGRHLRATAACRSRRMPLPSTAAAVRLVLRRDRRRADRRGSSADGTGFGDAVERVIVDRGELTLHVPARAPGRGGARLLRDEPTLAFELCGGVSGVHYPDDTGRELHAVYHLLSITHNRRLRLEVSVPDADPHIPSLVGVYPTCDWHERETWDFFGHHLRRPPRR